MSESVFDRVRRKWQEAKLSLVKAFVKWSVQKLDKVSVGSFLAFSWGIDDVTEYHVIVERSYPDYNIYGTKVTYYTDLDKRLFDHMRKTIAERSEE